MAEKVRAESGHTTTRTPGAVRRESGENVPPGLDKLPHVSRIPLSDVVSAYLEATQWVVQEHRREEAIDYLTARLGRSKRVPTSSLHDWAKAAGVRTEGGWYDYLDLFFMEIVARYLRRDRNLRRASLAVKELFAWIQAQEKTNHDRP